MTVARCRAGGRSEQPRRRPITGPQLELPFRLRHEHFETANRQTSFSRGAIE
jgi:hypothetical protein